MEQLELYPIPSPCRGICETNAKGYCKGCWRKREERFNWQQFTPAQQLKILKLCKQRQRRAVAQSTTLS